MADEAPSQTSSGHMAAASAQPSLRAYGWLRWTIRITGILLMFGGTFYLGSVAAALLTGSDGNGLFVVVVSVVALGVGIFVLRTGINMLRSIDAHAIRSYSFVFALIYSSILVQILPSLAFFNENPGILYLLVFLYFGLSYWVVKFILVQLLLPAGKS